MPKNRRRKQNQNAVTDTTAITPELDLPESSVQEPILISGNGDAAVLTPAPVLLFSPEPIVEPVVTAPTLRSLSNLITLELLAYVVVAIAALLLRLVNLDARPLAPAEAQNAAAAFQFLNGQTVGAYGSPLIFTLNWLAFLLFGAFDMTARFLPVVLSALLVFVPLLGRNGLGKTGALVAAILIAISPTLLFFGRAAGGADLAVGGALAALILFYRYRESQNPRILYFAAALAALGMTADSAAFTILIAGGIYFAIGWAMSRRDNVANDESETETTLANTLQNPLVRAAIVFVAAYVLAATTFLLNRDGLGVAFNLFGEWANEFSTLGNFTSPLNVLIVYEPLALIFGLAGLVLVATARGQEGQGMGLLRLVGLVAVLALIFYSLAGNKAMSVVVAITLPMAVLAGWFVGNLLERARDDIQMSGGWRSVKAGELPVFVMLIVLAALIYLQVVTFLHDTKFTAALDGLYKIFAGGSQDISLGAAAVTLAIIMALLLAVFIGLAILLVGLARTTTLLAVFILVLFTVGELRATWLLNFSADEPLHELVAPVQSPLQVRDLVNDLEFHSQARWGDSHVMKIVADPALGAVGQWYLRAFPNLVWSTQPGTLSNAEAIVTPATTPPPGNWMGQQYRVRVAWQPENLDGINLWKWYIFRDADSNDSSGETYQTTMLWLPTETK